MMSACVNSPDDDDDADDGATSPPGSEVRVGGTMVGSMVDDGRGGRWAVRGAVGQWSRCDAAVVPVDAAIDEVAMRTVSRGGANGVAR